MCEGEIEAKDKETNFIPGKTCLDNSDLVKILHLGSVGTERDKDSVKRFNVAWHVLAVHVPCKDGCLPGGQGKASRSSTPQRELETSGLTDRSRYVVFEKVRSSF